MKVTPRFSPEKVLIMYKCSTERSEDQVYFEMRDTKIGKHGKTEYSEGHALTPDELSEMMKIAVTHSDKEKFLAMDYIPENLIYANIPFCTRFAWWIPAGKKKMKFKSMKIKSANCFLPALFFFVDGMKLQIFALKDNIKPDKNTQLYYAPLYNIYHDGNVCMGNITIRRIGKVQDIVMRMKAWEQAFFESEFTSHGAVQFNGDILKEYSSLSNNKKPFPVDKMIKVNLTIKDAIK
jgi:PRTRC genetic system protein B